jgi:hypothetical protein
VSKHWPAAKEALLVPDVINTAEELFGLGGNAIVVFVADTKAGGVVLVSRQDDGKMFEARLQQRVIKGRPFVCAVFPGLGPGTYNVHGVAGVSLERTTVVSLSGGRVAQVDWRQ